TGSIVSAGPSVEGGMGGPGGGRGGFGGMADGGNRRTDGAGTGTPGTPPAGMGQMPGGATAPGTTTSTTDGTRGAMGGGAAGGLLQGSTPGAAIVSTLEENSDQFTWVAAAIGSNSASGYQLATQSPVMAIGGFNGSDPSPTLAQFQQYVSEGKIHFFIAGGGMGGGMNAEGTATAISTWVTENFTATTVDGVTLYDLTVGG
ncbi:glycosyl transferase, partial [Rhodococcus erythropolis]|nr:glycosyl transferase [Rhodococcus erythropolis]